MHNNYFKVKYLLAFFAVFCLIIIYKLFNPYLSNLFPPCPFYHFTGLKCAGCGSQRAIHNLLNMDFKSAFNENALLVISIPYVLLGLIIEFTNIKTKHSTFIVIRNVLYGKTAMYFSLLIIFAFWIFRDLQFGS